jgi:8-oxo-dGTP diphosphatase
MPGIAVEIVLMTISGDALRTLLLRPAGGGWQLPRGTVGAREPLRRSAERIIAQQVGISVDYLEQLYTFGNTVPDTGERVIEICYYGLVPTRLVDLAADGAAQRAWFGQAELSVLPLLAEKIVERARQRLRGKLSYTAVGFELLPEQFTLAELQQLYEIILGKRLDKRNFRRRIAELGIVEATGAERTLPRGRPAALFSFKPEVFERLESRGDILAF